MELGGARRLFAALLAGAQRRPLFLFFTVQVPLHPPFEQNRVPFSFLLLLLLFKVPL